MSLEELNDMGLLNEQTGASPTSGVRVIHLVGAAATAVAACAMMIIGDGSTLTGWGIALFLLGFFSLIGANLRGVVKRSGD